MKRNLRRVLYSFSLLASMAMGPEVKAKIPPKSFKNVTKKYFKEGKQFYSPVLGEAILEAGTIHDLRFYGNFESGLRENERSYVADASNDPLWNLVKQLFPSPAGGLAVETGGRYNFGRLLKSPTTVSLLLNFAHDVREDKDDLTAYENKILESLKLKVKSRESKRILNEAIRPLLASIKASLQQELSEASPYPKHMTEGVITAFFCEKFETREHMKTLLENLNSDIVDQEAVKAFPVEDILTEDDLATASKKEDLLDMDDIYALTNASIFTDVTPYKSGSHLKSNGPTYVFKRETGELMTEMSSFPDCAEMGMRHFLNLLLFNPETREFDLTAIKDYVAKHSPDNPYFPMFLAFYDKQTPDESNNGDIMLRSLFNMVVADLNTEEDPYKINYVLKDISNEIEPGFINTMMVFKKVFGLQIQGTPEAGRRQWVRESLETLFTALNPHRQYEIDLKRVADSEGEISGELSIIVSSDIGKKLFSFDYSSIYDKHSEIRNLTNLVEQKSTEIEQILDRHTNQTTLAEGTAEEALRLLADEKSIFSKVHHPLFQLFNKAFQDFDSMIEKLRMIAVGYTEWKETPDSPFSPVLPLVKSMVSHIFENNFTLDPETLRQISPLIPTLAIHPEFVDNFIDFKTLNILFSEDALDEAPFINFSGLTNLDQLRTLYLENIDMEKSEGIESPNHLEKVTFYQCKNLKSLSLRNYTQLKDLHFTRVKLGQLSGIEALTHLESLKFDGVRGVKTLVVSGSSPVRDISIKNSSIQNIEGIESLPQLERLKLSQLENLGAITFQNCPKLEVVELKELEWKKFDATALKNLKKLKLKEMEELTELDVTGCHELTELDLEDVPLSKVTGLETLPKLKRLKLTSMDQIKNVPFENLISLNELILSGTELDSLDGLEKVSHLTKLKLGGQRLTDLSWLTRNHFPHLRELDLSGAPIQRIEDLTSMPNIEKLKLFNAHKLEDVTLSDVQTLVWLDLSMSVCRNITLEGLLNLSKLDLADTRDIKLALKNNQKLKGLSIVDYQSVDLENLSGLTSLRLFTSTKRSSRITLKNNAQLERIDFGGSVNRNSLLSAIHLENLDAVEELDFSKVKSGLIKFKGTFKNLKKITFNKTHKRIKIEGLTELEGANKEMEIINRPKMISSRKAPSAFEDTI